MDHLVDTNVLLRSVQHRSPSYRQARNAVVTLLRREDRLCLDARLVAAMNVHAITSILTFDVDDFKRYPGIRVLHPQDVTPVRLA
jgi:predicted nucleic acid-binding protein